MTHASQPTAYETVLLLFKLVSTVQTVRLKIGFDLTSKLMVNLFLFSSLILIIFDSSGGKGFESSVVLIRQPFDQGILYCSVYKSIDHVLNSYKLNNVQTRPIKEFVIFVDLYDSHYPMFGIISKNFLGSFFLYMCIVLDFACAILLAYNTNTLYDA